MRISNFKSAMIKSALAATILLSASGAALAQQAINQQAINLTAAPANAALSDGSLVPMWGYRCGTAVSGSTATCAALNPTAAPNWSPVVITVPTGQVLTINLTNNLSFGTNGVPTSLVIVGQIGGGLGTGATSTLSPDHSTVRSQTWPIASNTPVTDSSQLPPTQGNRVQSFATEVTAVSASTTATCSVATGATPVAGCAALTWAVLQPGTYLIESGTHPSIQGPMGLYGVLVVTDGATGTAYPAAGSVVAVTYNADIPLLFSEIDPVQNTAVSTAVNTAGFSEIKVWSGLPGGCGNPLSATGTANTAYNTCYPPAVNYTPLYYLINGRSFDTTNAAASLYPVNLRSGVTAGTTVTGKVLVRLVNAGLKMHVPAIVGASTDTSASGMTLVAEDGNVLPGLARIQNEVFMAAGKTYDVMINVPATVTTALPIYDRELSLSANATGRNGGMLAYIGINGAGLPAAASALGAARANADTYNALAAGQRFMISDPAKGVVANDVRVYGVALLTPPKNGQVALNPNGTFTYAPSASGVNVALSSVGSGYTTAPTVTFSPPPAGGTLPTATATIGTSGVSIALTTGGSGYLTPTVTIGAPPAGGTQALATATLTNGIAVTLTAPGSGYVSPTVTVSAPVSGIQATATATVTAGAITSINITNPGSGYTAADVPSVTVSDATASAAGATATAALTGVVSGITVTNAGSGYAATPSVSIADVTPGASGATATASVSASAGTVTGIMVTYIGSGYTTPPTVGFTGGATATATVVPGNATADSFTYCANGTVTAGVCSSGISATVTLGASSVLASDTGITCTPSTFTSTMATAIAIKTPGVLAGCTDGAKLPLTVDLTTVTPAGMTVVADANGGFTATATGAGTPSFSFKAKNSLGLQSGATTVTVVFPTPSWLTVNVLDGVDHVTPITDYRWIIEEDRTFYVDPACTKNPLPTGCPTISSTVTNPINYGTNFHTSSMPVVAAGCTGTLSCEGGQMIQGKNVVCDVGNGGCRTDSTGNGFAQLLPSSVALDPSKRYYISILPGDAATPFNHAFGGAPDCSTAGVAAGHCGHGMGGAPIAAACGPQSVTKLACAIGVVSGFAPITVLTMPTPLQPATLSVFVYEDDFPLNGEHGSGGGVDVLAPQEPGLGGFQVTIFDQAGGTGDSTGQPTYDMFNQPLSNSLAGTIDPVTGLDACPISKISSLNSVANAVPGATPRSTSTGMIVTCPKFESDGQTLSPMAGQALVKNLYPGRYGIAALPGSSRIALGEEWVQTNTLDGQKAHDSFLRVGEPGYFQEFGPAGFHVSIGYANPKIINERRYNDTKSGMCDPSPVGGALACTFEVKGKVTGSRLSRTPDQRLYSSGDRSSLSFTQCYVSLGDPDGAEIAFSKCDGDGNFDFKGIPAGNWKVTTFDQWNDQIIDGITQPVAVGCPNNVGGKCSVAASGGPNATTCSGTGTVGNTCDMGEIGVHQWQADIYTRSFIDMQGTGVSDNSKPGLALAATNVRFRDGSFSNFNNTDLNGYAGFNEVFPLFNWYVIESDSTRYKNTGVHVIYDAGGPADGSASCNPAVSPCGASQTAAGFANTYEKYPLPADLSVPGAVYCATGNADCVGESIANGPKASSTSTYSTGRIDPPFWFGSYGWQGYIGQGNFLEWGKKPFAANETGPIHGHVVYASTRPFDDPQLLLQLSWEPLVAHVHVNLYQEGVAADGVTQTLKLVDQTDTTSWDDWAQGFRSDGKPNMNCPGQQVAPTATTGGDPFFYALNNQPQYLDWYKSQHGGPAVTALPYGAQYKCYDGMHTWNQLQPAPYDGMYSFPSATGFDPATGKPSGTNCTACTSNTDTTDAYRVGAPMLPPGKYVVEVVVPPGYELVKEEDKNILIGDNYIAPAAVQIPGLGGAIYILPDQAMLAEAYNALNPQNATTNLGRNSALPSHEGDTGSIETYWPCVGEVRQVPDYISLFPQSLEVAPFAGAFRSLCDRKEVTLDPQSSALAKFYLFSSTHVSSHFQGIILDDFAAEFDPFSPQFGEKFAPAYVPVGVKDWSGNSVNRVYTDQFGLYNGLNYSTWEVNPPNPTGYAPTMMTMCMNDAGFGATPDPLFQPGYSQFCYELPFMPGQTGYFDTPVVPVQAFASGSYNTPDCALPDATPAVASVIGDAAGPWVSAATHTLTITALGDQSVDWYGYSGPSTTTAPYNQQKISRHYGFGTAAGKVTIGGIAATVGSWSDTQLTVTVPNGVANCAVQQQAVYGGSPAQCGQLVITTSTGKRSVDAVTVTIGGKQPTVLSAGATIQSAIDAAQPGDMIIVPQGTYNEMLVMWKPVRLQGVGAATTIVDANAHPAGRLLNPWREKIVGLFGLTPAGRPDTSVGGTCTSDGSAGGWCNFASMTVDRLPFEATLGWDATLNGNLAEQMIEPSLLGAYEGAVITVLGKGVKFPRNTSILDAFGATAGTPGASFPVNTTLLSAADCGVVSGTQTTVYPTNFYCNPSSIDGLGVRNSSQGGGGIFVHGYAHNLQIANNRVNNNTGTMSGGMTIGTGEHPEVALGGSGQTLLSYPTSCETSNVQNLSLPFCFNEYVNIHNNAVVGNSSMGDELFSSTPAGAGGVSINTGSDYYKFANNWVCGNLSSGDGGGVSHIGFIKNGRIEHNSILFNQTTNPSITTNGGGLLVMGAPDADPTTCGVSTDLDCLPAPGEITPSDGSGPGLVVNANLILGNAADSGSGGGLRLQHVNGTDVLNIPSVRIEDDRRAACSADLGAAGGTCLWNSVNVTNNIIVNNVAGWDGGGVSLVDALAVNIVNNTIASNDSTASSGTLLQSLFAPLASSTSPTSNVICGAGNGSSCPQVAGLVSVNDSPVLVANIQLLSATPTSNPFRCPSGHGTTGGFRAYTPEDSPSCVSYSIPAIGNDVIWQNRSFYIGVGGLGTATNQNQQNIVTLYPKGSTTRAADQSVTGGCPEGSTYWDLGFRGDTDPTAHTLSGFVPNYSVVSAAVAATYGGSNNLNATPAFTNLYCNGSRSPPELGVGGYTVPPGVNEFNAFPNPLFTLSPSGVVDEGNNWINVRWGPLALTSPATGAVLGDYAPTGTASTSSAIDHGDTRPTAGTGTVRVTAPRDDYFGNIRPGGNAYDIGAVEVGAPPPLAVLTVTGGPLSFTAAVGYPSAARTLTLRNTGNIPSNLGNLVFSNPVFSRGAGGTCGTTLNYGATCTITVVFTPTALGGPVTGTLTIVADVAVAGSPVALSGTGVQPFISATLTPTTWTVAHAANCPNGGLGCLYDPGLFFNLTNTGNVPLTGITQGTLSGANTADFLAVRIFSSCGPAGGVQLVATTTLAPGATCATLVQFKPLTTEALGTKTVTLSVVTDLAGTQTASLTGTDAAPTLASIAPTNGARGATTAVTLSGTYLDGATAIGVSGTGVTCTIAPAGQTSLTTLTANCAITNGAVLGARTVTVTTPTGTTGTVSLTVIGATVAIGAPNPVLTTATANTATKYGTITVSNAAAATGPLTLTANPAIAKVETAGGRFSIVSGGTCVSGFVVAPGGSCSINVRYVPGNSTALATANVTIAGSGMATATLTSANFTAN